MTDEENSMVRELVESAHISIWLEKLVPVAREIFATFSAKEIYARLPVIYVREDQNHQEWATTDDSMWDVEDEE